MADEEYDLDSIDTPDSLLSDDYDNAGYTGGDADIFKRAVQLAAKRRIRREQKILGEIRQRREERMERKLAEAKARAALVDIPPLKPPQLDEWFRHESHDLSREDLDFIYSGDWSSHSAPQRMEAIWKDWIAFKNFGDGDERPPIGPDELQEWRVARHRQWIEDLAKYDADKTARNPRRDRRNYDEYSDEDDADSEYERRKGRGRSRRSRSRDRKTRSSRDPPGLHKALAARRSPSPGLAQPTYVYKEPDVPLLDDIYDLQKIEDFCSAVERQGDIYPVKDRTNRVHKDVRTILDEAIFYDEERFAFLEGWKEMEHQKLRDVLRQFHYMSVMGGVTGKAGGVARDLRPALLNLKLAWSGRGVQEVSAWLTGLRRCVEAHKAEWMAMSVEARQMLIKDFATLCVKPQFAASTFEAARHPQKEVWLHISVLLEHKRVFFLIPSRETNESDVATSRSPPSHLSAAGKDNMHYQDLYGLVASMCRRAHNLVDEALVRQEPVFTPIKGRTYVYGEGVFEGIKSHPPPSASKPSSAGKRQRDASPTEYNPNKRTGTSPGASVQRQRRPRAEEMTWDQLREDDADESDREDDRPGKRCYACGRKHLKGCTFDHHPLKNTDATKEWGNTPQALDYARLVGRAVKRILPKFGLDGKYIPRSGAASSAGYQQGSNLTRQSGHRGGHKGLKSRGAGPHGKPKPGGEYTVNLLTSATLNSYLLPCDIVYNNRTRKVEALLDSGAHRVSYISSSVLEWIKEVGIRIEDQHDCSVCSGLSGMCAPCLGRVKLTIRVVCDNGLPYEFPVSCVMIDSPYDLFIGMDAIPKHDLTLRVRSYFTEKNSKASDNRSGQISEGEDDVECDSSAGVMVQARKGLRHTSPVTEKLPAREPVGTQYEDCLPYSLSTLYTKEELLDLLPEDLEPEEDPFFRDPDHPSRNPEGSEILPVADGNSPALPHIDGDTPFHNDLRTLILEYRDVFSAELSKVPAKIPPMKLKVDEARWYTSQNRAPPRPQSPVKRRAIREMIEEMLQAGVIAPSQASAYSQVLLVPKPNGAWRFCVDYRSLNEISDTMG